MDDKSRGHDPNDPNRTQHAGAPAGYDNQRQGYDDQYQGYEDQYHGYEDQYEGYQDQYHEYADQTEMGYEDGEQEHFDDLLRSYVDPADADSTVFQESELHGARNQLQDMRRSEQDRIKSPRKRSFNLFHPLVLLGILLPVVTVVIIFVMRKPTLDELLKAQKYEQAIPLLKQKQRWSDLGEVYQKQGRLKLALKIYIKAKAWKEAADLLFKQKDFYKAAKLYEHTQHWEQAATSFELAKRYNRAGEIYHKRLSKMDKAYTCYQKGGAWRQVVEILVSQKKYEKAAVYCEKKNQWEQAGDLYRKLKRWDEAFKAYKNANQVLKQAQILMYLDKPKRAARLFASKRNYRCEGAAHLQKRDYKNALKAFQRASKNNYEMLLLIGKVSERLQRIQPSRKALREALKMAKKFEQNALIFELYEKLGKYRKGLKYLKKQSKRHRLAGEYYQAMEIYNLFSNNSRLTLRERFPFLRAIRKMTPKMRTLPTLTKLNITPYYDTAKGTDTFGGVVINGTLEIPESNTLKRITLRCRFFHKNITQFTHHKTESISPKSFCREFQGSWKKLQGFEAATPGQVILRTNKRLAAGAKQTFRIKIPMKYPYKNKSCVLQIKEKK